MECDRVVDLRPDAVLCEPRPQFIAAGGADDVLVVDVVGARVGPGEDNAAFRIGAGLNNAGGGEQLVVTRSQSAAALIPLIDVAELDQQDGSLEGVQWAVPA